MARFRRFFALMLSLCLLILVGCSAKEGAAEENKTKFILGDTTFNAENEEPDLNPHNAYAGWACIRYGVGETLFRYSDSMEITSPGRSPCVMTSPSPAAGRWTVRQSRNVWNIW